MQFLFFVIAFLIIAALMPKPQYENARAGKLGDFRFPRSNEGDPVPIVWGTVRLRAPNTIWYGDFRTVAIKKKVKSGFSSKKVTVGHKYYLGVNLALALGPNVIIRRIWAGKHVAWEGELSAEGAFTINKPNLFGGDEKAGGLAGTVRFYPGTYTQTRNSYLASKCDPNVPCYGGISHVVFESFYWGTTTNVEPLHFELSCFSNNVMPGYGIMPNGRDVNPIEILYDAFASKWGRLGIDVNSLNLSSWQAAAVTLYNEGNGMSLKLESLVNGKGIAEEVLRQIDGIMYQDPETSKVNIKLLRFDYDVNTIPVLDVSKIKDVSNFQKTTWESTFNQCRITFNSREKSYEESVAVAQDFGNINYQQRVKSTDLDFPGVTTAALANQIAARQLSFYSVPLYKFELKCLRTVAATLRPGDVFSFSWAPYGISQMVARVQRVNTGTLKDGMVTLQCIQDKFATQFMSFADPVETGWQPPVLTASQVATRKVFEAPNFFLKAAGYSYSSTQGALYVVARAPSGASQSFDAETSLDSFATSLLSLEDAPYVGSGRLTAGYASTVGAAARYDATGFTLDLIEDPAILQNYANRSSTVDGRCLLVCNGEIMSYASFVNNGNGSYTLTGISRGLFDTKPETHNTGDYVYFIEYQEGLTDSLFSDTATVGVRLRDRTHAETLDPASAAVDSVTLARRAFRPLPPAYLTLNGSRSPSSTGTAATIAAAWRERNRNSGAVVWYDDASETPEAGTTYTLRYRLIGAPAWTTVAALATPSYTIPAIGSTGTLEVEVFADRDGVQSRIGDYLTIAIV